MRKITLFNTTFLTGLVTFSHFAFAAPTVVPNAPELSSRGYVLMDYHTGKVLVERDADKRLNPASLTKLMTAYVAGQEVNAGNISLDDQVVISRNAWAKNFPDSSKMFIEVNTSVPLSDLYRGLVVQSGNDASVAIAEHVAGSEAGFVSLMNSWASQLGLTNSSFTNPHGLDSDGLYSTPHDIAKLGQAIIRDLPDIYPMYSETSFTYNGITQYNRNGLLRDRSMNVDGMKTGYTSGAGYSLATSATNGDMRLIAVVMGAKSQSVRESESKQLLSYGFRFYDTLMPTAAGTDIANARVWMGQKDELKVGVNRDVYLTLPKGDVNKLKAEVEYNGDLLAPIAQDQVVGTLLYKVDGKVVKETELVALEPVEEGGIFKRIMDWFKRLVASWF
ncbi:D-alanyl-D-alanine carboxypeptidase family protein [Vibrio parahaemolyticus]|uniref:serine-type D-Ala-D-Ala carboxypeptidase n=6 Tax=Vibrio parahaemolyticus TaxID=670 RepID=Q87GL9_VIBPA|nr:D-alanyl-D-alanine carboxypeptidase family protein [Vibrio parahaemolyticus]EFO36274.1 serine-type D-Ala-D-Ala carboxypeptidase DacC [Vibrio parahaemolyticus Peru-466]EFO49952.1 serine-type D-Ala-D-Ala carboxypeptidase DacC [Vibrio parahaemolyticus K5030]ARC21044.1 D-alanyl-D-alanine carboxypeptidase [Vibrio parahaemolyticus]AZV73580.1 D-alanyl-D-alanine carboxypeptidase [Vibrio parahaemolyticus]EFO41442.1 serine-type D-Ala-D-Ala carboxypeptidase DacC [Vibrio parahaemolyticus AN-5034]